MTLTPLSHSIWRIDFQSTPLKHQNLRYSNKPSGWELGVQRLQSEPSCGAIARRYLFSQLLQNTIASIRKSNWPLLTMTAVGGRDTKEIVIWKGPSPDPSCLWYMFACAIPHRLFVPYNPFATKELSFEIWGEICRSNAILPTGEK